jgi:hypothetical protein
MSTSAPRLRVEPLLLTGRTGRRVTVACSVARNSLGIAPPTERYMAEALPYLKAATIFRHESDHPGCDTERLWAEHDLQQLRAFIDQQWDAAVADKLKELAN